MLSATLGLFQRVPEVPPLWHWRALHLSEAATSSICEVPLPSVKPVALRRWHPVSPYLGSAAFSRPRGLPLALSIPHVPLLVVFALISQIFPPRVSFAPRPAPASRSERPLSALPDLFLFEPAVPRSIPAIGSSWPVCAGAPPLQFLSTMLTSFQSFVWQSPMMLPAHASPPIVFPIFWSVREL